MTTSIALTTHPSNARSILLRDADNKDTRSRVGMFADWLTSTGRPWHAPDMAAYRDHLLTTKNPASTSAHLSSIRAAYLRVMRDNAIRDELYTAAGNELHTIGAADTPASDNHQVPRQSR